MWGLELTHNRNNKLHRQKAFTDIWKIIFLIQYVFNYGYRFASAHVYGGKSSSLYQNWMTYFDRTHIHNNYSRTRCNQDYYIIIPTNLTYTRNQTFSSTDLWKIEVLYSLKKILITLVSPPNYLEDWTPYISESGTQLRNMIFNVIFFLHWKKFPQ